MIESAFEAFDPSVADRFDLVFAATAWHWLAGAPLPARVGGPAPRRPPRPLDGTHVFPRSGDPFFFELQEVDEEIGEGRPDGATYRRPGELPDEREEIEGSGLFEGVVVRHFDWEVVYDTRAYLRLLDTFSDHIAMKPWQRDRLYSEIRRRLGKRADRRVARGWGAVLHVARRVNTPSAA